MLPRFRRRGVGSALVRALGDHGRALGRGGLNAFVYRQEVWLREEATRPDGSFVAFEGDDPVGYAGLMKHANGPATAEHGLTIVRRDRRRRGIARALKQAQLHWASRNGVVELVTWTQRGDEAMQALNRSLGYVDHEKVITYHRPLP